MHAPDLNHLTNWKQQNFKTMKNELKSVIWGKKKQKTLNSNTLFLNQSGSREIKVLYYYHKKVKSKPAFNQYIIEKSNKCIWNKCLESVSTIFTVCKPYILYYFENTVNWINIQVVLGYWKTTHSVKLYNVSSEVMT